MSTICHRERSTRLQNEPWRALTLALGWGALCLACLLFIVAGFAYLLDIWPSGWVTNVHAMAYLLLTLTTLLIPVGILLLSAPTWLPATRIDQRGREEGYR